MVILKWNPALKAVGASRLAVPACRHTEGRGLLTRVKRKKNCDNAICCICGSRDTYIYHGSPTCICGKNIRRIYVIPDIKISDKKGITIYEDSSTGDLYEEFRVEDMKQYNDAYNYIMERLNNCRILKL